MLPVMTACNSVAQFLIQRKVLLSMSHGSAIEVFIVNPVVNISGRITKSGLTSLPKTLSNRIKLLSGDSQLKTVCTKATFMEVSIKISKIRFLYLAACEAQKNQF
jgi:hypothetical protein